MFGWIFLDKVPHTKIKFIQMLNLDGRSVLHACLRQILIYPKQNLDARGTFETCPPPNLNLSKIINKTVVGSVLSIAGEKYTLQKELGAGSFGCRKSISWECCKHSI